MVLMQPQVSGLLHVEQTQRVGNCPWAWAGTMEKICVASLPLHCTSFHSGPCAPQKWAPPVSGQLCSTVVVAPILGHAGVFPAEQSQHGMSWCPAWHVLVPSVACPGAQHGWRGIHHILGAADSQRGVTCAIQDWHDVPCVVVLCKIGMVPSAQHVWCGIPHVFTVVQASCGVHHIPGTLSLTSWCCAGPA